MSGTRLVVAALAATLLPAPAALAQVERVWLTHRTADPSKQVVKPLLESLRGEAGDRKLRLDRDDGFIHLALALMALNRRVK